MTDPLAAPGRPRTVKPRQVRARHLPIMAVTPGGVYLERTSQTHSRKALPDLILSEPSSILACHQSQTLLWELDRELAHHPRWQYRVTPTRPRTCTGDPSDRVSGFTVALLGLAPTRNRNTRAKYHHPLDPAVFTTAPHGKVPFIPYDNLLGWASEVRAWAMKNELSLSPTAGGLAAQLLRDKRFYSQPRRKVPRATNDKARQALPGNFYQLNVKPGESHNAVYVDMHNAHHTCASEITFPDANTLYAHGDYQTARTVRFVAGGERYRRLIQQYGLFLLRVSIPHLQTWQYPPPFMARPGTHDVYVYSNELPLLEQLGGVILGIVACWTSPNKDHGLNRYASWAMRELERATPERREWMKPTLLATYGILATVPRPLEQGYRRVVNGKDRTYPAGKYMLRVQAKIGEQVRDSPVANVIHRGMIEAECRARSLHLARAAARANIEVLAIYADSVFLASCPARLAPPWRSKGYLTDLHFITPTTFRSRELTRLPGIPFRENSQKSRLDRIHIAAQPAKLAVSVGNRPTTHKGGHNAQVPNGQRPIRGRPHRPGTRPPARQGGPLHSARTEPGDAAHPPGARPVLRGAGAGDSGSLPGAAKADQGQVGQNRKRE